MASLKKRNGVWYAQWYVGTKQRRTSLKTDSFQLAKEKLRQIESKLAQGADNPLPSRTPIGASPPSGASDFLERHAVGGRNNAFG